MLYLCLSCTEIYCSDELPLPSTTATEPAETETTPITTVEPTEITTTPSASVPTDNETEPSEPANTSTSATDSGEVTTKRYYFYKPGFWPDSEYSDTVGIYWWDDTDAPSAWPGYEAKKADYEGVYYYDVPKDVTTIIWNNFVDGGSDNKAEIYYYAYQTVNICTEFFFPDECVIYPNGVENFDGMIFVTHPIILTSDYNGKGTNSGNWYYYYGNGEYGITPDKGEKFYTGSFQVDIPSTADYEDISIILGDINNDRKLSIKDATLIQKYLAQIESFDNVEMYISDYNEDKITNIKDTTTIQKKLANII